MNRLIIFMTTIVLSVVWAEIEVGKVLETTKIEDYNIWVQRNRGSVPSLRPIHINVVRTQEPKHVNSHVELSRMERTVEPSSDDPYVSKYVLYFYEDTGQLKKTLFVEGYIDVWPYQEIDYVRVIRHDHPMYPSRSIVTLINAEGDSVFPAYLDMPYVRPTDIGIFIEYPMAVEGRAPEHATTRIFNSHGRAVTTLENVWTVDEMILSPNKEFLALYVLEGNTDNRTLILMSKELKELWRKRFSSAFEVSISSKNYVAIGRQGKIDIYNLHGDHIKTYDCFKSNKNTRSQFTPDATCLMAVLDSEVQYYNILDGRRIWQIEIPEMTLARKTFMTDDGKYAIIVDNSLIVRVIDNSEGVVVKSFRVSLGEELHLRKRLNGREITLEEYRAPINDWKCDYIGDYLIFKTGWTAKRGSGSIVVYRIETD